MDNSLNQKPCVVETPQGFSVSYKQHFLYSKYNPSKTILQTIEALQLLPGTIILCFSPALDYGIKELITKLPEDCFLYFCEADLNLYDFSKEHINTLPDNSKYCTPQELYDLPLQIYDLSLCGKYKRVIRIDFSAGVQFNTQFYNQLTDACSNSIGTFWKNRITLTKFGRRYSHNFFANLHRLPDTTPIRNYFNAIEKPILVFGAGQSLDSFFASNQIKNDDYFIICVDTALIPLQKRNIIPDAVFIEEAQTIISKAFIGANPNVHYFAGLSSLPFLYKKLRKENLSFFTTEYASGFFFRSITELSIVPPVNKPFGSVGLTAVYYALQFRKNNNVPVYVCGLDFSYSAGLTHAKQTLAHITRLTQQNRLLPVANYNASFNKTAFRIKDKNKNDFYTSPTLNTYAQLFNNLFSGEQNLFDAGDCGIPLAILRAKPLPLITGNNNQIPTDSFTSDEVSQLKKYLSKEKEDLIYLRDLLTGKTNLTQEAVKNEIIKKATCKEYLFLHFADGYCFNYNQSFLNRIRTEIDFFLKLF